jgi:hypothetical protein
VILGRKLSGGKAETVLRRGQPSAP